MTIEPSAETISIISTVLVGLWVGIRKISKQLEKNTDQLTPNGGVTLRDAVDRIEKTVFRVESQLRAQLDLTVDGYFITDTHGKCTWVSRGWTRLTGVKPHDAIGEGWLRGIHPEDRSRVFTEWQVSSTGTHSDFHLEYRTTKNIKVCADSIPLTDREDTPIGYIGVLRRCP